MNINKKLKILGFDQRWVTYGFLTTEKLEQQFDAYSKATTFPNSQEAQKGFGHPEHIRHRLFWDIAENNSSFSDKELLQLIELVNCDEDPVMAKSFYMYLLTKNRVTEEQLKKFPELKE